MRRVAVHTLGCKVNQYESSRIADDFRRRGYEVVRFSDQADVYIVNSCTVTHTADSKSRQAARAAVRRNPEGVVVLTGCYAQTQPERAREIDGVSLVLGNQEKMSLVDHVERLFARNGVAQRASEDPISKISDRTRALLKIQDGCDQFCAYCSVPLARPVMTSRPVEEVLREAADLADRGFREIVLTGIRLGTFEGLVHLIERIAENPGVERIRLSSIELTDIPSGLLKLIAGNPKLCRHLHIPLQSGCDATLKRMRRPYTTCEFASFMTEARSLIPGLAATTDVMVGFPGESVDDFEETCRFVEKAKFSRIHVFPYSCRPGTASADMPDDIPSAEKTSRKAQIMALGNVCAGEFAASLIGQTVAVLVEGKKLEGNFLSGFTDNYTRVIFPGDFATVGRIVPVYVESSSGAAAYGKAVD